MTDDEKQFLFKRLSAILASLESESDRGCVLVVATMVEQCLERQILRRLLPPASAGGDELMSKSKNSPISSFSAKIDFSYRLGLIPEQERAIYHQLRELRNACAHEINEQRFSADRYKDRITNIVGHSEVLWEAVRQAVERAGVIAQPVGSVKQLVEALGWRYAFELFFGLVIARKEASLGRVTRIGALHARPLRAEGGAQSSGR